MRTATDRTTRDELKCVRCGGEITPGLHICLDGDLVWFEFHGEQNLRSILEVMGQCVSCGHRCRFGQTEADPDYTTPRCPKCHNEWRAVSATDRDQ